MSTIPLYGRRGGSESSSPLPHLLQTPSGLALLEIQGTINLPEYHEDESFTNSASQEASGLQDIPIGRLAFPNYNDDPTSNSWMKPVHLYVGKHQRLTGEVKKLPKAIAVIRRRSTKDVVDDNDESTGELEVVEIVKLKIIFSQRPEPVGTYEAGE
ncbi:chromosome transmission fidelity protein 8 [Xylogone sp. PMI_703]|nr:chromosome transmission fidelity protein 8 [Xylogone sp. PMI_703]